MGSLLVNKDLNTLLAANMLKNCIFKRYCILCKNNCIFCKNTVYFSQKWMHIEKTLKKLSVYLF